MPHVPAKRNPLEYSDPVHELACQMVSRGDKTRSIGTSMLAEAIMLLRVAGFDRDQIVKAADDVLSKVL